MTSYIVSTYNNGSMNVDSLRSFDNEVDARAYAASLAAKDLSYLAGHPQIMARHMRIYKVSDTSSPVKLTFP